MNCRLRHPLFTVFAAGVVLLAACRHQPAATEGAAPGSGISEYVPPLIPLPARIELRSGGFSLPAGAPLRVAAAGDEEQEDVARFLTSLPEMGGAGTASQAGEASVPAVLLAIDPQAKGEGAEDYTLDVTGQGIRVTARQSAGLFYGAITAWQLLTPAPADGSRQVPALHIEDHPRFAWRGLMLDVARHYMPPQFIEQLIDWMALHKLNTLHWHLTDDQGWRLQIRKYPRLTSVGAWRIEPDGTRSGGFYTQEQVRALVRYAAARQVTIVPEIDMPGHAQAAVAAYPRLGSRGDRPKVSHDWGVHPYLLNVDDPTFGFIEDVLGEVLELFPSHYIHVGGDEAVKTQWQASPRIQARLRALGVKDENALQGWFMRRLESWLAAHGRCLIGWDEIVDAGLPATAAVMSWRGTKGGIAAAKAGHDVVMSPAPTLYFDYLQSGSHDEPPGRPDAIISLEKAYAFDPRQQLDPQQASHIIGVQANVWTEHIATPAQVEHAVFPRIAALAETAWSPAAAHDWPGFLRRVPALLQRYHALGIRYADSAFAVRIQAAPADAGAASVELSTQTGLGAIRYTLDGSAPQPDSPRYQAPLSLRLPVDLRADSFLDGRALAAPTARHLDAASLLARNGDELGGCSDKLPLRLAGPAGADGTRPVYHVDVMDPCWTWPAAPLDGVAGLSVRVARLPFNFQLGAAQDQLVLRLPRVHGAELEIHRDSCAGPLLAALAPDPGVNAPQDLQAAFAPQTGVHELCLYFSRGSPDPLWVLDTVQLQPRQGLRLSEAP